jgi:hypothetical protein
VAKQVRFNFGLVILRWLGQTGTPMKTRPWTIALILATALTSVVAWQVLAQSPKQHPPDYDHAPVKRGPWMAKKLKPQYQDCTSFIALLEANEAVYCVKCKKHDGDPDLPPLDNGGCKNIGSTSVDPKTRDLVLICGGGNVTQRAGFNTPQQAANVDAAFQ